MVQSALSRPGQRERYDSKIGQIDWVFVALLIMLAGIGALIQYSVGGMSWEPWAYTQLRNFALFLAMALILAVVDLRFWLWMAYPAYAVSLILLVLVELIGDTRMGAQRWLEFGPVSFQPSEFMKLAIVLALARFYHERRPEDANWSWWLLVPALMIAVPSGLVMHQPDLGTAMLILLTGGGVMILAGLNWKAIAAAAAGAVASIPLAFFFVLHEYQRNRILTFLNPEGDPSGDGYHILQSKIAMGSGGLLGKGLGLGSQSQLNFLPEKHTDFIMAAVCEELGLVGGAMVLLLSGLIIIMALRMAALSHSHFGRLAASGAIATYACYVLINGAMVMGLFPVVGIPMPLVSYGGSVMLTVMAGFGLILGVKVHRYQELPKQSSMLANLME
ncbi:rod shape-determining protein RodA [Asticcacaulis biprosthecium C19]|uniref:Peptidoglycan glycosyltransferase MrdB n=1 Tax=Asticcacaulis biprosthecium C19 TaxID=715226 RepID=F4QL48_9CAUL|nr:rod shape-determining protein RodA [Asticcacaulis biprosthecium]EGF93423.1 rod shape-determining protein RodA [Asticcacaulis biprosthecium C19]